MITRRIPVPRIWTKPSSRTATFNAFAKRSNMSNADSTGLWVRPERQSILRGRSRRCSRRWILRHVDHRASRRLPSTATRRCTIACANCHSSGYPVDRCSTGRGSGVSAGVSPPFAPAGAAPGVFFGGGSSAGSSRHRSCPADGSVATLELSEWWRIEHCRSPPVRPILLHPESPIARVALEEHRRPGAEEPRFPRATVKERTGLMRDGSRDPTRRLSRAGGR